jgi:hypothetical protein
MPFPTRSEWTSSVSVLCHGAAGQNVLCASVMQQPGKGVVPDLESAALSVCLEDWSAWCSGGEDLKFPHHDNELAQAEAFFHQE